MPCGGNKKASACCLALTLSGGGAQVSEVQLTERLLAVEIDEKAEISNLCVGGDVAIKRELKKEGGKRLQNFHSIWVVGVRWGPHRWSCLIGDEEEAV